MMQNVLKTNQTFGVNLIKKGNETFDPGAVPYEVGCTARIVQVEPQNDGHLNITVVGDERYHILQMGVGQPYLTAFVESTPLKVHQTLDVVRGVHVLRARLVKYLSLLTEYTHDTNEAEDENGITLDFDLRDLQLPEDPMMLIYLSAALLQIPAQEKQPLLEADTAADLLERIQRLYRRELAVLPPLLQTSEEEARLSAWVN